MAISETLKAWGRLLLVGVTIMALFVSTTLATWALLFSAFAGALFLLGMWAGPNLAAGLPVRGRPKLAHEGFASAVFAFFVASESVPTAWGLHTLLPQLDVSLLAGGVVGAFAVLRSAWAMRDLALSRKAHQLANAGDVAALGVFLETLSDERAVSFAVAACSRLIDQGEHDAAAVLLDRYTPRTKVSIWMSERWALAAFRARAMAGEPEAALALLASDSVEETDAIKHARLWASALAGHGQEVLDTLDSNGRPDALEHVLEDVVRAHALVAVGRDEDARAVLARIMEQVPDLADVQAPPGPASVLAREMVAGH